VAAAPEIGPEISIVVVCYEMARELPRTLQSLSPAYQRNCPPGRCELIVIDNGSSEPPNATDFAGLGLDLTLHCWPKLSRSPVAALNFGLGQARAPVIGAWIDGARMASPGLIDACARAAALHPRAVVATYNYHLGTALQYASTLQGYDAAAEDALLASIDWPSEGYRLFEIATPDWRGGPTGPTLESNALFLRRALWDELGGFDARFNSAGGGMANPDLFVRACELPDAQLIRVQGEATFHQIHGGVSTGPRALRALKGGSREYLRITGRPLALVKKRGWLFDPATDQITT
jgi:hypothetical protein